MAANSLLYLLLATGLTSPPEEAVTTESQFGVNDQWQSVTRYPEGQFTAPPVTQNIVTRYEDEAQWRITRYDEEPQDSTRSWEQESEYKTDEPQNQFTAPPVTLDTVTTYEEEAERRSTRYEEEPQDFPISWAQESEYKTLDPTDQFTAPPDDHAEVFWRLVTQVTEAETDQPQASRKKHRRKCPKREHLARQCDKTCSNYLKPCPRKAKRSCVCDGGLVRNKAGTCVPRDQCQNKLPRAEDKDSHGCPYEYACDVFCIKSGKKGGKCEGDVCACFDK